MQVRVTGWDNKGIKVKAERGKLAQELRRGSCVGELRRGKTVSVMEPNDATTRKEGKADRYASEKGREKSQKALKKLTADRYASVKGREKSHKALKKLLPRRIAPARLPHFAGDALRIDRHRQSMRMQSGRKEPP